MAVRDITRWACEWNCDDDEGRIILQLEGRSEPYRRSGIGLGEYQMLFQMLNSDRRARWNEEKDTIRVDSR